MPRDLNKEITDLKAGLHQFTMSMYACIEKLVDEKDAKEQVAKVLQEEINYIRSTQEELDGRALNIIDTLKKEKAEVEKKFISEKDDNTRYLLHELLNKIEDIVKYLETK